MKARLEYVSPNKRVLLEDMELEELDQYTYKTFDTVDDIKKSSKYKTKIGYDSSEGDIRVFFETSDIPLQDLEKYAALGGNPLGKNESLSVLVYSDRMAPSLRGVRNKMASFINSESVAREFYNYFEDEYTPKERLEFFIGMDTKNSELVSNGIRRVMKDFTSGYEGYFLGRTFVDTMKIFESVKTAKEAPIKK